MSSEITSRINMAILPYVPNTILRSQAQPVTDPAEAMEILEKLEKAFKEVGSGVGLAAPQIGIPKAVAIVRTNNYLDLVNPRIIKGEELFVFHGEGCLSLPGRTWDVTRFKNIRVEYQTIWPPLHQISDVKPKPTEDGKPALVDREGFWMYEHHSNENLDITPVVIQHEVDHLLGILLDQRAGAVEVLAVAPIHRTAEKVGRNDPCPCGSGAKFKKCCLDKVPAV